MTHPLSHGLTLLTRPHNHATCGWRSCWRRVRLSSPIYLTQYCSDKTNSQRNVGFDHPVLAIELSFFQRPYSICVFFSPLNIVLKTLKHFIPFSHTTVNLSITSLLILPLSSTPVIFEWIACSCQAVATGNWTAPSISTSIPWKRGKGETADGEMGGKYEKWEFRQSPSCTSFATVPAKTCTACKTRPAGARNISDRSEWVTVLLRRCQEEKESQSGIHLFYYQGFVQ